MSWDHLVVGGSLQTSFCFKCFDIAMFSVFIVKDKEAQMLNHWTKQFEVIKELKKLKWFLFLYIVVIKVEVAS